MQLHHLQLMVLIYTSLFFLFSISSHPDKWQAQKLQQKGEEI